jgi:phage FluMu protein Com
MESTLKLIQLKCANCHSTVSRADKFETQIKCPYCGTVNQVTGTTSADMATPERIILFKTEEKDFDKSICNFFVDQDYAVNDIFQKVQLENATAIYLPMFLYEGRYEANYSCSVGYQETELRTGTNLSGDKTIKEKTVTKWRPTSGTAKENYAFLSLAFEGKEITPELAEWTKTFPYEPIAAQNFEASLITGKGLQILPHNMDKEATWHKWGTETIEYLAKQKAYAQLPDGQKIKDFKSTFSYDQKHDGRLFLIPFWFVYYHYNNEKHYVLMDGLGRNIHGSTPIDEARYKAVKKFEKLGNWAPWLGTILTVILFFTPAPWWLAIGLGVGGWLGLKFYTQSKVKTLIEGARQIRKAAYDMVVNS